MNTTQMIERFEQFHRLINRTEYAEYMSYEWTGNGVEMAIQWNSDRNCRYLRLRRKTEDRDRNGWHTWNHSDVETQCIALPNLPDLFKQWTERTEKLQSDMERGVKAFDEVFNNVRCCVEGTNNPA